MTATTQIRGDVAVITLANPPVNGLGYETRLGIVNGLEQALNDAAVKAIVITGAGKAFSGGADIREFGSPKATAEPNLLSVILALEASSKPIVAAIHSVAMGGGLELALGCHYRVTAPGAQIAKDIPLSPEALTQTFAQADLTKDQDLANFATADASDVVDAPAPDASE